VSVYYNEFEQDDREGIDMGVTTGTLPCWNRNRQLLTIFLFGVKIIFKGEA
jgi:hypothetical protein